MTSLAVGLFFTFYYREVTRKLFFWNILCTMRKQADVSLMRVAYQSELHERVIFSPCNVFLWQLRLSLRCSLTRYLAAT